ncbi:hypothetical protein AAG570_006356 [Ranatra chinensis]|uniref:SPIN-DOC-like zinc-finger domain-containing protein n=1 Tax=Ranatra chinensis TaxID=642074 RepID=A0ABD0Z6K0_9HEMI
MSGFAGKRKIDYEGRVFKEQWSENFFFVESDRRALCLICNETIAVLKEYNIRRHYMSKHNAQYSKFTGEQRIRKLESLKQNMVSLFLECNTESGPFPVHRPAAVVRPPVVLRTSEQGCQCDGVQHHEADPFLSHLSGSISFGTSAPPQAVVLFSIRTAPGMDDLDVLDVNSGLRSDSIHWTLPLGQPSLRPEALSTAFHLMHETVSAPRTNSIGLEERFDVEMCSNVVSALGSISAAGLLIERSKKVLHGEGLNVGMGATPGGHMPISADGCARCPKARQGGAKGDDGTVSRSVWRARMRLRALARQSVLPSCSPPVASPPPASLRRLSGHLPRFLRWRYLRRVISVSVACERSEVAPGKVPLADCYLQRLTCWDVLLLGCSGRLLSIMSEECIDVTKDPNYAKMKEEFYSVIAQTRAQTAWNSVSMSEERYASVVQEVIGVKTGTIPKRPRHYSMLKNYDVVFNNGAHRLVSPGKNVLFVNDGELFDILYSTHVRLGHRGRDKMAVELQKKYKNITRHDIQMAIETCDLCSHRRATKRDKFELRAADGATWHAPHTANLQGESILHFRRLIYTDWIAMNLFDYIIYTCYLEDEVDDDGTRVLGCEGCKEGQLLSGGIVRVFRSGAAVLQPPVPCAQPPHSPRTAPAQPPLYLVSSLRVFLGQCPGSAMNSVQSLMSRSFHNASYEDKLRIKLLGRPTPDLSLEQVAKAKDRQFTRRFNPKVYKKKEWLCGCELRNALFCFPCLLFGGDFSWTKAGIRDLNHLAERIKKHDSSPFHVENVFNLAVLGTYGKCEYLSHWTDKALVLRGRLSPRWRHPSALVPPIHTRNVIVRVDRAREDAALIIPLPSV